MKSLSDCITNAILLLDDEIDITFSFKQGLEDKGYHVFGFTEPLLALDHFQMNSEQYSLVISDIRMRLRASILFTSSSFLLRYC
jgi:DNA-binding NtrC family response regulator